MNGNSARRVRVEADDEGVVAYAGLHALATLADELAVGDTLSAAIPWAGPGNGPRGTTGARCWSTRC